MIKFLKNNKAFVDPNQIMSIILVLIIFAVGVFVVYVAIGGLETSQVSPTYDETFTVTDSSVNQDCSTDEAGMTGITVTQYNGLEWVSVDSAFWSYSGTVVTVTPGGMD